MGPRKGQPEWRQLALWLASSPRRGLSILATGPLQYSCYPGPVQMLSVQPVGANVMTKVSHPPWRLSARSRHFPHAFHSCFPGPTPHSTYQGPTEIRKVRKPSSFFIPLKVFF